MRPGDKVFVGSACATPRALVEALEQLKRPGVVLVHFLTDRVGTGDPPHTSYRHRVFYVGRDVRAHDARRVWWSTCRSRSGTCRSCSARADPARRRDGPGCPARTGRYLQPGDIGGRDQGRGADRTHGHRRSQPGDAAHRRRQSDSVGQIARFVPVQTPVVEYLHDPVGEVAEQIARYVARLVDDRSTLQVGLGRVPNEMLARLTGRRGLAIHSDVITEPVVDLVAAGVITGPVATSWAMGSRRLYDWWTTIPGSPFIRSSTSAIPRSLPAGSGWCR